MGVASVAWAGWLEPALVVGYWGLSALTWWVYRQDKRAAQRDTWRTPEARLHLLGFCGGWPGALLARELLRHKTQKQPFTTLFWLTIVANCALLGWWLLGRPLELI